ncbi:MAG: hypothetical protein ACRD30_10480 [Bryobacteraceae bacterium]
MRSETDAVSGVVRSAEGDPIEGVLVMGADLNYVETDPCGRFRLARPEMAVFFWCTGFLPEARPLIAGEQHMDVTLRPVLVRRASA